MALIFLLLFIAAIIGLFRPYKFISGGKRWHYGFAAFACFILTGVFAPEPQTDAATLSSAVEEEDIPSPEQDPTLAGTPLAETAELASKWRYDENRDEMRDSVRKFAEVESENSVDLDFPYGEQRAFLTVRSDPQYGLDVMFRVRSGQILCHGFGDSFINAKFDDGDIRRFNCTNSSDGSSDVAFVENANGFLSALKSADRTVIEAEFYQNGRVQYVFDTRNLEWE